MARFFSAIGKVIGALMALAVAAYLLVNGVGWIKARGTRAEINKELTSALAQKLPPERAAQRDLIALPKPPEISFIAEDCEFPTTDSGWIVQSYRQACRLVTTSAWPVTDRAEANAILGQVPERVVGDPVTGESPLSGCTPLRRADSDEGTPVGSRSSRAAVFVEAQANDDWWCGKSYGPAYRSTILDGTGAELDPARNWLVVTHKQELGEWNLGCLHWSILFCDNPFGGKPAMGTPPV